MGCFFCRRFEDNATTSKSAFRPLALSLYSGQARLHVRCPPRRRCLTSPLFDIYSALLRFTPLYSTLLRITPLYSALLCSNLLYSAILCSSRRTRRLGARCGSPRRARRLSACAAARRAALVACARHSLARVTLARARVTRACRLVTSSRLLSAAAARRARRLSARAAALLCAVNWNRRCFKFLRRKRRKEPNRLTRTTLV